jgi:hypothetical protein
MRTKVWQIRGFAFCVFSILLAATLLARAARVGPARTPQSTQDVLMYHGDNNRTGWFSSETQLTAANVNSTTFGLLETVALDGVPAPQPLVVLQQSIQGQGTHDVVYIETSNNSVYAFDADSGATLWQINFGPPVKKPAHNGNAPVVGIMSTPVIDLSVGTMYVVASTYNGTANVFTLHAISLSDGADLLTPETITFSATLYKGGTWVFNPDAHLQRPALLEANGNIYVAFGSTGDNTPAVSRGLILAYNAATLQPAATGQLLNLLQDVNPPYYLSSIWMSGYGPAADSNGDIYFSTGNSDPNVGTYSASYNHPESVIQMSSTLQLLDSFTPYDYFTLDQGDKDVSAGGVLVLPDQPGTYPHLVAAGGKDGRLFLMDRDNLGGYTKGGPDNVLQIVTQGPCFCGPAYFVGSNSTPYVVTGGQEGVINWTLQTTSPYLTLQSTTGPTVVAGLPGHDGTIPVVSSNGTTAGTGVVWFVQRPNMSISMKPGAPITLWAYSAANLTHPLFSTLGGYWLNAAVSNAYAVPTVANGKVYVASNLQLSIFGLLDAPGRRARHSTPTK